MSANSSPEIGVRDQEQTQAGLLKQFLDNQEAIQGLSDKLMQLLVSNLQRLAESNRPSGHAPRDPGADGQTPRDPRRAGREQAGQHQHVSLSGETDARMGHYTRQVRCACGQLCAWKAWSETSREVDVG